MLKPKNRIEELAYCELLIDCQATGCGVIFEATLNEPATDPVEFWAVDMARRARQAGWSAEPDGRVCCPEHGKRSATE